MSIASNLERLRNEIVDACARAHRDPSKVALMAVSKTHSTEAILEALAAGQRLFGENRVQEYASKYNELAAILHPATSQPSVTPFPSQSLLSTSCAFHLIGPLQNNKTGKAAEIFDAIDTIDALKTAQRLNAAAQLLGKTLPLLIEVKLSPEAAKHGLAPEDLPALLMAIAPLTRLQPCGLMTVPPFTDDPNFARPFFQRLRQLRDELQPIHPTLTELSMGMSNDFAVAIEEGSTTVRLGTAIFGKRGSV